LDAPGPHHLRVFDADTGGAHDSTYGRPDTVTFYRLYGEDGAASAVSQPVLPDEITRARDQPPSPAADGPGTLLDELSVGEDSAFDDTWRTFFEFDPDRGEVDGDYAWFRLD